MSVSVTVVSLVQFCMLYWHRSIISYNIQKFYGIFALYIWNICQCAHILCEEQVSKHLLVNKFWPIGCVWSVIFGTSFWHKSIIWYNIQKSYGCFVPYFLCMSLYTLWMFGKFPRAYLWTNCEIVSKGRCLLGIILYVILT